MYPIRTEGLTTEILFAVHELQDTPTQAYGVSLKKKLLENTGRDYTLGAIYITLQRMCDKGWLTSSFTEPTKERGGRAKRVYSLEEVGITELEARKRSKERLIGNYSNTVLEK